MTSISTDPKWSVGLVGYGEVGDTRTFARSPDWRTEADRILAARKSKSQAS